MDYIVPMPMTAARLQEYIDVYDIDLSCSCAVIDEMEPDLIFGIGMLGVRPERGWITRLGVLPYARRLGTGGAIMDYLVTQTRRLGLPALWLEVIVGNDPALRLFQRYGFTMTRELIVSRRPPKAHAAPAGCLAVEAVTPLKVPQMLELLGARSDRPNWLNETESFANVARLNGFMMHLERNARGWMVYESSVLQMKRVVVEVLEGDPPTVTQSILHWLHQRLPVIDATSENIPIDDPRWAGYAAVGYFDSFHRYEMVKDMTI